MSDAVNEQIENAWQLTAGVQRGDAREGKQGDVVGDDEEHMHELTAQSASQMAAGCARRRQCEPVSYQA